MLCPFKRALLRRYRTQAGHALILQYVQAHTAKSRDSLVQISNPSLTSFSLYRILAVRFLNIRVRATPGLIRVHLTHSYWVNPLTWLISYVTLYSPTGRGYPRKVSPALH